MLGLEGNQEDVWKSRAGGNRGLAEIEGWRKSRTGGNRELAEIERAGTKEGRPTPASKRTESERTEQQDKHYKRCE